MAEQILLGFFWCSLASLALVAWTSQSNFFNSILSIILEFLSIFKIFGIALLAIISLGIVIVLWEQVISKTQLWNKISSTYLKTSNNHAQTSSSQDGPQDEQRSILPIVIVIVGLGIFAILDTSFLLPSGQQNSSSKHSQHSQPPRNKKSNQNKTVIQFFSAILTLAVVVGFIVFNKDEYRAWKARRRLSKHHRRRARQEHSLNSPLR
ncbi:uncharacterized protein PGTG_00360 [Puccinia graminis f. sp. tritici CRL 75-36-700-3]|uniref:Uncharacterized protein n=1 Tax=Puccinia graminis f. sp. tritici (strain CRL 75-36-700-3 / race SCCL) TaxID=418459 RepID=E3JQQ4_PUCGT|nr:uncharacterized protein PGTG_00360 [Puccinia graminis f. sp. tritici CRL 75-36-700-3]EFP74404.1 hypothetical protein PGTG_00360 [Puccinia graminis f. sp. tritici CRL 75-36-700-3]